MAVVHYERLVELLLGCGHETAADSNRFVAARLPGPQVMPSRTARELRRRAETDRRTRRRSR